MRRRLVVAWSSSAPRGWLSSSSAGSRLCAAFIDYSCAVEALVQRRRALIGALEQAAPESAHAEAIARLRCFRGDRKASAERQASAAASFHQWPTHVR